MWREAASKLTRSSILYALHWSSRKGYLYETGWTASFRCGMPVDKDGRPVPWITYSSLALLKQRVSDTMSVFEYGCGNSTLWWAQRVKRVVSVEHDRDWYARMKGLCPPNVELSYVPLSDVEGYASSAARHPREFDIVVIDGRERVRCTPYALQALKDTGVIVWDNSDRPEYQPGFDVLLANGFRCLDFPGMGPINTYSWSTSVFYRQDNCLGL